MLALFNLSCKQCVKFHKDQSHPLFMLLFLAAKIYIISSAIEGTACFDWVCVCGLCVLYVLCVCIVLCVGYVVYCVC